MKFKTFAKRFLLWLLLLTMATAFLALLYGIRPVYIKSGSMEPTLPVGSLCFVNTRIMQTELNKGDIIVFSAKGVKVAHRIIGKTQRGFRTKGDANDNPDLGEVSKEHVEGIVIGAPIPLLGYVTAFLRSQIGIV